MAGLLDFLGGGQQQDDAQPAGIGGMSNSLIGLGMGLLQPYNPWAGTNAWTNALQGYQAGAALDQRTRAQQQQAAMEKARLALAQQQANRDPEGVRLWKASEGNPAMREALFPKTTGQWHFGQITDPNTEQQYPWAFNASTSEERWPMGKPPGYSGGVPGAAPSGAVAPAVPGTTLYWPGQQSAAAPDTTGTSAAQPAAPSAALPLPPGTENLPPSVRKKVQGAQYEQQAKLAAKQAAAEPEQKAQILESGTVALRELDAALKQTQEYPGMIAGPFGNMMKSVPGSQANDVAKRVEVVKANIAFDKLQAMRRSNPSGGALGNVSDKDMALLQNSLASLEQSQTPQQFIEAMKNVRTHYANVVSKVQGAGAAAPGGGGGAVRKYNPQTGMIE